MDNVYKSFDHEDEVNVFFGYIFDDLNIAFAALEEDDWLFDSILNTLTSYEFGITTLGDIWKSFMEEAQKWTPDRVVYEEVVINSVNDVLGMIIRYELTNDVYDEFVAWASKFDVVQKDTGDPDREGSREFRVEF